MNLDTLDVLFAIPTRKFIVNALNRPACGVTVPAVNPGSSGGTAEQPSTVKYMEDVASGVPATARPSGVVPGALHGVKSAVVVAAPHAAGVSSGARGPPFEWIFSFAKRRLRRIHRRRRQLARRGIRMRFQRDLELIPVCASSPFPPSSRYSR